MIWSKWLQIFKEASVVIIYIISKNKIYRLSNFWGCPAPSKNHFFQKNEFWVVFWHIRSPILCKCSPNQLKLAEILHLIKFHTLSVEKYYSVNLKTMTPFYRAIFPTPLMSHFKEKLYAIFSSDSFHIDFKNLTGLAAAIWGSIAWTPLPLKKEEAK